jgi:hypothetical protein
MAIGNTPPIYSQWPALSELANKNEPDIRPLLRSHKEAGLDSTHQDEQEVLNIRERLDKDLEKIAALELRAQCGDAEAQRELTQIAPFNSLIGYQDVGPFLKRAEQSSAFVQYLNSYLYFVVRFAAGRLTNPCEQAAHDCKGPYKKALEKCGNPINERPVGLPTPPTPVCKNISPEKIRETIDDFLEPMLDEERKALQFLDNSLEYPEKIKRFELWLRGLHPPAEDDDFNGIVRGLYAWANRRCNFYVGLEYAGLEDEPGRRGRLNRWLKNPWLEGQWQLTNPLAARYGLVDFYWLALLLRAEVSPRAIIRYDGRSWLSYLMGLRIEGLSFKKDDLLRIEEVLRSVFDFACDLIQNAVEMAEYCEDRTAHPDDYPENITSTGMVERKKPQSVDWRSAFDDELKDIAKQRKERIYLTQRVRTDPREVGTATKRVPLLIEDKRTDKYWSIHLETGEGEQHLVGIALSGGGIRSATFCLGVLEALKEGDRLRYVDYLSTVSGGGYIGAWLLGNVRRTNYWLSRLTSWKESIDHLRRYSKYLAPQSGFLSADSWVIWGTWIRNSFLIQLTAVAWLAAAFVLTLIMGQVFDCVRKHRLSRLACPHSYYFGRYSHLQFFQAYSSSHPAPNRRLARLGGFFFGCRLALARRTRSTLQHPSLLHHLHRRFPIMAGPIGRCAGILFFPPWFCFFLAQNKAVLLDCDCGSNPLRRVPLPMRNSLPFWYLGSRAGSLLMVRLCPRPSACFGCHDCDGDCFHRVDWTPL